MTLLSIWFARLSSSRHLEEAECAERSAMESRLLVREAVLHGNRVYDVSKGIRESKERNHYADQVARAFGLDRA